MTPGIISQFDEVLGSLHDFKQFLAAAHQLGMHVILDGVFNHVGADSRYFNAVNEYSDVGAANSLIPICLVVFIQAIS